MERSVVARGEPIALPREEVHVWQVPLELHERDTCKLAVLLSQDERARAARFKRIPDRDAFVICRGALRLIVSWYIGEEPGKVCFEHGPWGKPMLAGVGAGALQFSVSHSHAAGIVAFARGRDVGIDVELIQPLPDADAIAERFFSRSEVDQLKQLPADLRLEGFFRCWTRKEAFVKATGKGLSLPLDQFSVSLAPDEPAVLVDVLWDPEDAGRWRVHDVPVGRRTQGDYAGALVAQGHDWHVRYWEFDPAVL